jgi:hypothetical protein
MKKTILALALILMTFTAFAQDNNEKSFRVPSGYQGFFEVGTAWGLAYNLSLVNAQYSTSHGYQFTDKIFGGLGAGVNVSFNHPTVIPFYGAFHYIFTTNKKVSPVVRTRAGAYYVPRSRVNLTTHMTSKGNSFGAYGDLGFGVRIATESSIAFSLMAVATYYSNLTVTHYQMNLMGMGGSGYYYDTQENISSLSLVFSLEW